MKTNVDQVDLAIIGAGPAGLSAARVALRYGLRVVVLDEFPSAGGRMMGQFHEERGKGLWVGRKVATEIIDEIVGLGVQLRTGASVHGLEKTENGWDVLLSGDVIHTKRLLLATGAAEIPAPLPGWTLPGVMSIGAAQVMTNVHFVKPGNRGLVIGVNVLAMAIAQELTISGVHLAGIVLPPAGPFAAESAEPLQALNLLSELSHLSPSLFLRFAGTIVQKLGLASLAVHVLPKRGIQVAGVPLKLRTAAISINGTEQVESVTLVNLDAHGSPLPRSKRDVAVDFVAIAGGLYPLAELASVAGCEFIYNPALGGHIPVHSEALRTQVDGVYVAGNITGVESALVALAQGELAGTTICYDAGVLGVGCAVQDAAQTEPSRSNLCTCDAAHAQAKLLAAMQQVRDVRAAAPIQFKPGIAKARSAMYT